MSVVQKQRIDERPGLRYARRADRDGGLAVTGMKLFDMQTHLLSTYEEWGGRALADDVELLMRWLLNTYIEVQPRVSRAWWEAHGNLAYASGPTAFLKQLFVIEWLTPLPPTSLVRRCLEYYFL